MSSWIPRQRLATAIKAPWVSLALPYARARSAVFTFEGLMRPAIEWAVTRRRPRLPTDDPSLFMTARASLDELLRRDVAGIEQGLYPASVLTPESWISHVARLPRLFREGLRIARRRQEHSAHEFSAEAQALLEGLPDYYRRCFHYQGDGYLSRESAELYDHQVDVLFAGATDAMRRLILAPLKEAFPGDGEGLRFLELGAGTGRATRFVRLAFPKAKIVAIDLSAPYLKRAQEELRPFARHDFVEADAADLPFLAESFDAVYSVFLFHEIPHAVRAEIVREAVRVLKPGGFFGFVDSLQLGDRPELDLPLKTFPIEFHEPFYRDYIQSPMSETLAENGITALRSDTGFFSKVMWGRSVVKS